MDESCYQTRICLTFALWLGRNLCAPTTLYLYLSVPIHSSSKAAAEQAIESIMEAPSGLKSILSPCSSDELFHRWLGKWDSSFFFSSHPPFSPTYSRSVKTMFGSTRAKVDKTLSFGWKVRGKRSASREASEGSCQRILIDGRGVEDGDFSRHY